MLLLDVGENADGVGADRPAVAEEGTGVGLGDEPLVGDRREGKALGADEAAAGCVGDGDRGAGAHGQDLKAEGQADRLADGRGATRVIEATISGPTSRRR